MIFQVERKVMFPKQLHTLLQLILNCYYLLSESYFALLLFKYFCIFFIVPDLDLPPFYGSAQRKNPLGTPGSRCYSPLSSVQTSPAIKEEEPVTTSPPHTDSQNNATVSQALKFTFC